MSHSDPPENSIYQGRVMHLRLRPVRHQFRYRVFSLFLDIDKLSETLRPLKLLGFNRFGLMSFHDRDHGARDGSALRSWVDTEHEKRGMAHPARVMILAFPRILGFVFNPLTIYYCYDDEGRISSVLYEVKNTFGDQVAYLLPCEEDESSLHQEQKKMMYVSPFVELDQTYHFQLSRPDARMGLRIRQGGEEGETLISAINADQRKLSDRELALQFAKHPLMTLKVVAGIHYEALRLFLKGVRFRRYSQAQIYANEQSNP